MNNNFQWLWNRSTIITRIIVMFDFSHWIYYLYAIYLNSRLILLSVVSIRKYIWFSVRNHLHEVRIVRLTYPISLSPIVGYNLENCRDGGMAFSASIAYVNISQDKVVWLHSGTRNWCSGVLLLNNISRVWKAFIFWRVKINYFLILYFICKFKGVPKLFLKQNVIVAAFLNKKSGKVI